jgi:ABC-2 type transport system permease protein
MKAFFFCELRRILASRPAWLVMFAMLYALLSFPVIVNKPPPEIEAALEAWFGTEKLGLRLILFAWFDLVMNKLAIFAAAILAAGIITDERSKQTLDIFLSKPVTLRRYFVVKTLAAAAAITTLYVGLTTLAAAYFSLVLANFSLVAFLAMSSVHAFSAIFAAAFAALMAVSFRHKLSAMLATIAVLSLGVGLAFAGFYQPAWASWFAFNPISQGVSLIATAELATAPMIARPLIILLGMSGVTVAVGAHLARRMEAQS